MKGEVHVNPLGAIIGVAVAGGASAAGAAIADRHPAVGAVVGSAVLNTLAMGLLYFASPLGQEESVWPAIFKGTAISGVGGALGASISDRRPALGAFIGSAISSGIGGAIAVHQLRQSPKSNGQVSEGPRSLHLGSVRGFP
jgi:hypothetical protein